jgi:hypothetical protein
MKPSPRSPDALKPLLEQAETAAEALEGFRKLAQSSADQAVEQLADLARTRPDAVRREQLEQRALLHAYEAAVMAARARSQAERLRAILAEGRVALAGGTAPATGERAAATGSRPAAPPAPAPATAANEVEVPNVVGARLDEATRDLMTAGLRVGAATGPRDGFVVKQTPAAGARVARQSGVALTLSTTAVGVTPLTPR